MRNKPVTVVLFKEGDEGARVYKNPPRIEDIEKHGTVLVNPDLTKVNGVSPSDWRLKDGKIVAAFKLPKVSIKTLFYLQILTIVLMLVNMLAERF